MQPQKNNMATASLVMGILSIILSCCCFIGIMFASLGLLFACLSRVNETFEGYAKAGLVTSIIGLVLSAILIVVWIVFAAMGSTDLSSSIYGFQIMIPGGML
ncbi:hypothetical protein GPL15_07330 [Clostridium sp. MCC353]|uniref:hypothetical protein n=1 Tax=Clostridium sp. MCC353 TaxID=2592646 RepID=UPI001C020BB2|nr:hypothetical protein [Clostridium sp. MCC353]MBT9776311.1 hypothetical protein [Clostridium sp. MCC353]